MNSNGLASLLLPLDAFDTNTHQVMGRRVAGSSFAQGLAASLKQNDKLSLFTGSRAVLPALQTLLQPVLNLGAQVELHADLDPALIAKSGCLHLPDPALHHWCWLRADGAASRFSLTGVTHTLCSHAVMQSLEQLVTAPLEPWDALVCTSRSALQVVQAAMACMHERLERRFQLTLPPPQAPQLPTRCGADGSSARTSSGAAQTASQRAAGQKEGGAGQAAQGQGAHVSAQQRTAWRRRDGARTRTEGAGSERGIVGGDGTGAVRAWLAVAR